MKREALLVFVILAATAGSYPIFSPENSPWGPLLLMAAFGCSAYSGWSFLRGMHENGRTYFMPLYIPLCIGSAISLIAAWVSGIIWIHAATACLSIILTVYRITSPVVEHAMPKNSM